MSDALPTGELRYEPSPRWVRGEVVGATVVDSRDVRLVWEPGRTVPGWCFPLADVAAELLRAVEPRPDERAAPVDGEPTERPRTKWSRPGSR